jgi:FixJ family two-component response regulator
VDDDESVREALEDLVNSLGFVGYAFESAEDFLGSTHVRDSFCVITDEQMPGMKGHELHRHLRAHGHEMPVIFITAFPEKCACKTSDSAGVLAVLEKPFDCRKLVGCLRDAVARGGGKALY